MSLASDNVAQLMARFRQGDRDSANQLVELLYPEIRRLAASKMKGERSEHTWQPTVLVNELYLELVKIKALRPPQEGEDEKAAFLGLAGYLMRRLLIHHSRPLYRQAQKVGVEESERDSDSRESSPETLQQVEGLLSRLERIDPKFRTVVEMRVFEGKTGDEIAEEMGCSPRSVATYWNFAKRWLEKELAATRGRQD